MIFSSDSAKDWETYDQMRNDVQDPCDRLENDFKKYRKFYDPEMFQKKLAQKKATLQEVKVVTEDIQSEYYKRK